MKTKKSIQVKVQADHLNRLAMAKPKDALEELIWNAFDADATRVDVLLHNGNIVLENVIVKDDGHGIPYVDIETLFSPLGGSWKSSGNRSPGKKRFLHGSEGKGRFKAFALGRCVDWVTTYKDTDDTIHSYTIEGNSDNKKNFDLSPNKKLKKGKIGTKVVISEINDGVGNLGSEENRKKLTQTFAHYLTNYRELVLTINGEKISPEDLIINRKEYALEQVMTFPEPHTFSLEIIEWKEDFPREIFLCDDHGFPFDKYRKTIRGTGDFSYSVYIKSRYIRELNDCGSLQLKEMDETLLKVINEAIRTIKKHFLERTLDQGKTKIDKWKTENIYPYKGEPSNNVEEAERKVFDILALNVDELMPSFDNLDSKVKTFQFRMLKQAVEKSPGEIQSILMEVFQLPRNKQIELAELLKTTSLSSIISVSKLVDDRLRFVAGLEAIIFDPDLKKVLRERTELHRLLAENAWVFGDEFALSVDDKGLTELLRRHLDLCGVDCPVNAPVTREDGSTGIIDLMLSRRVPKNHSNEREHLVVELKAPKVKIGKNEIDQIESYAFPVIEDERFRNLKTRWEFIVISNDFDKYSQRKMDQFPNGDGIIFKQQNNGIDATIKVKTWSQVIEGCKHRYEFLRQQLNHNIDSTEGLEYLRKTYSRYIQSTLNNPVPSDQNEPEEEELR